MSCRIRALAVLASSFFFMVPARAIIVYNGKIVPAWPDLPSPAALSAGGPGAARPLASAAAAPIHYYQHPAGTVWGLTLLVDFSDTPPAFTKDEVDAWLNL